MATERMEDIGFYTLSDNRAANVSATSPMWRCEIILTKRCNFRCPYCRGVGDEMSYDDVASTIRAWAADGLKNIRFSGGEPTLWAPLANAVALSNDLGVERIAISTNGSAEWPVYRELITNGVTDFSVSLDACCADDVKKMAGSRGASFEKITSNIRRMSRLVYTTVGVVLTEQNRDSLEGIVRLADALGVADIRVIPAAQNGASQAFPLLPDGFLAKHPILKYRYDRSRLGLPVRGIGNNDCGRCYLPMDDSVVTGGKHYPCVIWLREGGQAIGSVGPGMRDERVEWSKRHDPRTHPICSKNCLDVCVDHNSRVAAFSSCRAERTAL